MLSGLAFTLACLASCAVAYPPYAVPSLAGADVPGLPHLTSRIAVDQFGYLPSETKVAVISDPQVGFNAGESYVPGSKLEVRRRSDGKTVFAGSVEQWKGGMVHEDSGDRGWWFDFSAVATPGEYYVFDPSTNLRSPIFMVEEKVFAPILRAASRMYFYQRLGTPLAKPYAEDPWTDDAGITQDSHARSISAKDSPSSERDLSGGWMDAGDTDKYPPFNGDVIHPLLYAFRANPKAFGDANGIPESGNGLPDILDEVKFQLDWLVRMQFPDGGVPVKMGNIDFAGKYPLSQDKRQRYYGPKDTGAAIYTSAIFAHAARVYDGFPTWKVFAEDLKRRAILSWNWFKSTPRTYNSDTGEIKSGIANRSAQEQDAMEAIAAVHLFALTGDEKYNTAVKEFIGKSRQLADERWSPYGAGAAEAFVDYLSLPKHDLKLEALIRRRLRESAMDDHWAPKPDADLYRAWMPAGSYHWGSNSVRASYGLVSLLAAEYGEVDAATRARLRIRAADLLHSFHGVNPLGAVYLTNMGRYGAERSMMTIYHERYGSASPFSKNPPPGYVVGGPNQSFSGKAADGNPSVEWIKSQPRGKAYADMNKGWPENSWELSEPAIYYQAIYIRLLAEFAR